MKVDRVDSCEGARLPSDTQRADWAEPVHLCVYGSLAELEPVWRDFESFADATVFQSFDWLASWSRHIGRLKNTRPALVIGRRADGELLFLLPFGVEPHGPVSVLTWLGSDNNDYNGPMLAPGVGNVLNDGFFELWPEVLARIQGIPGRHFHLLHLVKMPSRIGEQVNPFTRLPATAHPSGAWLTHLSSDWDGFYAARRSPSTRRRDRTKRKRLGDRGRVRFVAPETEQDIRTTLDALIAQKTRLLAAMGARNIFKRPGWPEFYRSLATDPATRPIADLTRLDVGTLPAAIHLGLRYRGRYYHLLASHAGGDLARFSPGAAHLHELMRHAIGLGCSIYDFTVGDEAYKREWADTETTLFDHISAARTVGAPAAAALKTMVRAQRFVKQTPAVWNAFTRVRTGLGQAARLTLRTSDVGKAP
jgi:CelD/BcsL family acetyltransferase involved in cellulose biosynthesis